MLKKIVIVGSGGHFKVVINELFKQKKYIISDIVDINKNTKKILIKKKLFYIKNFKKFNWSILKKKNFFCFIAVGDNKTRFKIANEIKNKIKKKNLWATIISPDAIISSDVVIKPGSLVVTGSIINPCTKIGSHCIVNTKSSIDHDNNFSDFSSCGPGVVTGGNVKVGKFSFIGIKSVIINNIKIGFNTLIGAKSLVTSNCESNFIYFGSPAKKIKKNINV